MTLSADEVAYVAMLARIGLDEAEMEELRGQLDAILAHVSQLQQVDTSHLLPTAQVGHLADVWRRDEPRDSLPPERALANAPQRDGDYFTVGAIQE